jgi:hypothetical protein
MERALEPYPKVDVERTALYITLSNLLDTTAMEAIISFLNTNHLISFADSYPITRRQIEDALYRYFREGTSVIMREYDRKFLELVGSKHSIA